MNRTFLSILLALTMLVVGNSSAKAQDVLNYMVSQARAVAEDTTRTITERKIAVFKVDELSYMREKVLPMADVLSGALPPDTLNSRVRALNEQSFALHQFIELYLKRLTDSKKKNREKVLYYFKRATIDCPLFHDENTEITLSYFGRDDYPIQFSLDCDWVTALELMRNMDWTNF